MNSRDKDGEPQQCPIKISWPACQSNICPFEYNDNYLAGFKECYGKGYRLFNPCESEKPKYKFKIVNQIVENLNQLLSLECSWLWLLVDKRSIFSFVLFSLTRIFFFSVRDLKRICLVWNRDHFSVHLAYILLSSVDNSEKFTFSLYEYWNSFSNWNNFSVYLA